MSDYLPKASTTAAFGLLQSDKAYRIARWHAAHGVPPEMATQHALMASTQFIFVWFMVIPWAALVGLVYWTDNPVGIAWKVAIIYLALALWHRQKKFMVTDPRIRLHYRISTRSIKNLWYLAWVFGILLALS